MKEENEQSDYDDIDRAAEESAGHYFVQDFGHGYSSDIEPPGFGSYPASWTTIGPHRGRGPRNYRRPDERIAEDINERLTHHGLINATAIEVKVKKGEVELRGRVDSRRSRRLAEEIAESVSGAIDVVNQLQIGEAQVADQGAANSESVESAKA